MPFRVGLIGAFASPNLPARQGISSFRHAHTIRITGGSGLRSVRAAGHRPPAPCRGSHKVARSRTEGHRRMPTRTLGNALTVSPIGLGCMGISQSFGPSPERPDMVSFLRQAVDHGITFFDTAEVYGPFANEEIVGEALEAVRDQVVIATKFGFAFDESGHQSGSVAGPR